MAKKKAPVQNKSVLEQLADYSPPWEEEDVDAKADVDYKAELEEVKRQNATLLERMAKLDQTRDYSEFKAGPQRVDQQKKEEKDIFADLPDPVADPDLFKAGLSKKINDLTESKLKEVYASTQAERDREQLVDRLWDTFKESAPEWAEHEMLVEAAAGRISGELARKGVDVTSYVRARPEDYVKEVVGLLEKEYPQLKEDTDADDVDEDVAHRTAGVFGGTPGKATTRDDARGGALVNDEKANEDFLRSLAEARVKAGVR